MRNLPPKTRLSHFVVRVQDEVKKAAKQVKVLDRDKVKVSGVDAQRVYFTHQHQGNAQLTNEVVQVIFIVEERGFVVTLETVYGARGIFWDDFNLMMDGFNATPLINLPPSKQGPRKKLRAGEMVNPDMLKY